MAIENFEGKNIQDTFQRVVQTDGTNLADGTGSALPIKFDGPDLIVSGAIRANSYIVSESITNITSGSTAFGNSSDDTHTFTGNITASGNINLSNGKLFTNQIELVDENVLHGGDVGLPIQANHVQITDPNNGPVAAANIHSRLLVDGDIHALTHVTASGNISASGNIIANNFTASKGFHVSAHSGHEFTIVDNHFNMKQFAADKDLNFLTTAGVGTINLGTNNNGAEVVIGTGGHITASGNISASGTIITERLQGDLAEQSGLEIHGYFSGSGTTATGSFMTSIYSQGYILANTTVTANTNLIVGADIIHLGNTNNKISFGTDTQQFITNNSTRLDISNSGVRLGASNARVTTILDEDDMSTNSATALATQQSIKAYADTKTTETYVNNSTEGISLNGTSGYAVGGNFIVAGAKDDLAEHFDLDYDITSVNTGLGIVSSSKPIRAPGIILGDQGVTSVSSDIHVRSNSSVVLTLDSFNSNSNQTIEFINNQEPDFKIFNKHTKNGLRIASDNKDIIVFGQQSRDDIEIHGHVTSSYNATFLSASVTDITASRSVKGETFTSTVSTGTAPLTVGSTTVVSNLNADKLDGADLVDEDDMSSNSATKVPTQQSVKAYADLKLPLAGGTMTGNVDFGDNDITNVDSLDADKLSIAGGTEMTAINDEDDMTSNSATALATQQSIKAYADTKAPIASPTFTGTPAAPTPAASTDSTQIATTAYVKDQYSYQYISFFGSVTSGNNSSGTGAPYYIFTSGNGISNHSWTKSNIGNALAITNNTIDLADDNNCSQLDVSTYFGTNQIVVPQTSEIVGFYATNRSTNNGPYHVGNAIFVIPESGVNWGDSTSMTAFLKYRSISSDHSATTENFSNSNVNTTKIMMCHDMDRGTYGVAAGSIIIPAMFCDTHSQAFQSSMTIVTRTKIQS